MLENEDVVKIYREAMTRVPPSNKSEEALAMRKEAEREIKEAYDKGISLDLPFELPDMD